MRFFTLCALLAVLSASSVSWSSQQTCEALFTDDLAGLSGLNEASREYVRRIHYLLNERRLIDAHAVEALLSSPVPVNPLSGMVPGLPFLPHHTAFEQLMREDLQWKLIQTLLANAIKGSAHQQKREQEASKETKKIIYPIEVKSYPFTIEELTLGPKGQLIGVNRIYDKTSQPISVNAYEIPSGALISSIPGDSFSSSGEGALASTAETVYFTAVNPELAQITTVDLLSKKVFPSIPTDSGGNPSARMKPHYVDHNGQPTIMTFMNGHAYLFDPRTGQELTKVRYDLNPRASAYFSGVVGSGGFASSKGGPTSVVDFSKPRPQFVSKEISAIAVFNYHGKTYGIGSDATGPMMGNQQLMKTVDMETSEVVASFTVAQSQRGEPRLLDRFEDGGRLYGIIATTLDIYVVDLLKGEIIQRFSEGPWQGRDFNRWSMPSAGQLGFTFNGKRYFPVLLRNSDVNPTFDFLIIDPLTLSIVSSGYNFETSPLKILRVPGPDDEPQILVNFFGRTSSLIRLVNDVSSR